jgi:hypothetical protein
MEKLNFKDIIIMFVCAYLIGVNFVMKRENKVLIKDKTELSVKLNSLLRTSEKVVAINVKRDSILKPLLTRSYALKVKYTTSMDTSVLRDMDSLILQFTTETNSLGFNADD